ncbi:MAG: hypothetical protein ACE147_13795 [Candidatus Methylomirabilales bacterium]
MPIWTLVTRVPWRQVLRYAPQILDGTERLVDLVRSNRATRVDPGAGPLPPESELAERLAALERDQAAQAELLSQLAEQQARLSEALRVLATRVTAALWLAAAGVLAAALLLLSRYL